MRDGDEYGLSGYRLIKQHVGANSPFVSMQQLWGIRTSNQGPMAPMAHTLAYQNVRHSASSHESSTHPQRQSSPHRRPRASKAIAVAIMGPTLALLSPERSTSTMACNRLAPGQRVDIVCRALSAAREKSVRRIQPQASPRDRSLRWFLRSREHGA
ncbi:hypothetical protein GSI_03803 [Ganoderma sinense ZZ0214-1]|uniref:Uncharacterized protein n=1 Tax=Ganoderma sinense ZZ0214-1 TaxID=1077348 RepID=A0A2G8SJZ7_9APHY|nr:hypothetical protein GSI_03803 [Ganoderma sinense ZZ0214-1]